MNDRRESTHRHADEQLLVGWMVGAPGLYDDAELQHQQGQTTALNATAPTPTPMSNCS
jgi:hypothetical protein